MLTDLTLVLYRPGAAEVRGIAEHWSSISNEFRVLRILVSGDNESHEAARRELAVATVPVRLSVRHDNLGFASGHNLLLEDAFNDGADVAIAVNPDLRVRAGSLSKLSASAVECGSALVGPVMERLNERFEMTGLTDSRGIRWDKWGRHFDIGQGDRLPILDESIDEVEGVSGACIALSAATYRLFTINGGYFFDDVFLAYREDAELGIRAARMGVRSLVVHIAGFGHVRSVRGSARGQRLPDLLGVRNRFVIAFLMGGERPGIRVLAIARDCIVVIATLVVERSSLPGLISAVRLRRALQLRWRSFQRAS